MSNASLHRAKTTRNDEFYTLYEDIEKEMSHYDVELFRGKRVYCNCDSPESNFVKYFTDNYDRLDLAGFRNTWLGMGGEGNGDFRSEECLKFLKEADIVVSNPPFSIFREYVESLMKFSKKFIIVGNGNAITYKEVFKYIKSNKLWIGASKGVCGKFTFIAPESYVNKFTFDKDGVHYAQVNNACWFTNIPHEKRNTPIDLVGNVYSTEKYPSYENYDAIEVSKVSEIPDGYTGVMGVPISFLDKYCPDQFEIVGMDEAHGTGNSAGLWSGGAKKATVDGAEKYARIFIKAKKPTKKKK